MRFDLWRVFAMFGIPLTFVALNLAQWQASELDRLEITDGTLLQNFNYLKEPIKRIINTNDQSGTFAMVEGSGITVARQWEER